MSAGAATGTPSAEAFERLLRLLDDDRERAAERYQQLRARLVRLFAWRGCAVPEECADQTIDRVARKLGEGLVIEADDPYRYFAAVARRIAQESLRAEQRRRLAHAEAGHQPNDDDDDRETPMRCLERCLDTLAAAQRALVVGFYRGEGGAKIAARKRFAARLGITVNALRIRAHRLRGRLAACVRDCLRGEMEQPAATPEVESP